MLSFDTILSDYCKINGAIDNDYVISFYATDIDTYFSPINTTNTNIY